MSLSLVWQLLGPREMPYSTRTNAVAVPAVGAYGGAWGASLIAATTDEFALLRPAFRAPTFDAAPSDAVPAAALIAPAPLTRRGAAAADILTSLSVPDTVSSAVFVPLALALSSRHPPVLRDVSPAFLTAVTLIQTIAGRELQVEDIAREPREEAAKSPIAFSPGFEPLTLVVSLREQKLDVYRGADLVTSSKNLQRKAGPRHQGRSI